MNMCMTVNAGKHDNSSTMGRREWLSHRGLAWGFNISRSRGWSKNQSFSGKDICGWAGGNWSTK